LVVSVFVAGVERSGRGVEGGDGSEAGKEGGEEGGRGAATGSRRALRRWKDVSDEEGSGEGGRRTVAEEETSGPAAKWSVEEETAEEDMFGCGCCCRSSRSNKVDEERADDGGEGQRVERVEEGRKRVKKNKNKSMKHEGTLSTAPYALCVLQGHLPLHPLYPRTKTGATRKRLEELPRVKTATRARQLRWKGMLRFNWRDLCVDVEWVKGQSAGTRLKGEQEMESQDPAGRGRKAASPSTLHLSSLHVL
jgi:hypothetical protein